MLHPAITSPSTAAAAAADYIVYPCSDCDTAHLTDEPCATRPDLVEVLVSATTIEPGDLVHSWHGWTVLDVTAEDDGRIYVTIPGGRLGLRPLDNMAFFLTPEAAEAYCADHDAFVMGPYIHHEITISF